MAISALAPTDLRKLPPDADALITRGEWSWCALEHSRIEATELEEPGSPFHHLALPLGRAPPAMTFRIDGPQRRGRPEPHAVTMIQAGAAGRSGWDAPMESACLYFTDDALACALGLDRQELRHDVRSRLFHRSPAVARLLRALLLDAAAGRPHGPLLGDAVFVALAAELAPSHAPRPRARSGEPWRVRSALAFIHAHLTDELSVARIAEAAGTSAFHLSRAFRAAVGCPIWRYVLRERARLAAALLADGRGSLTGIALDAGFATYPAFIAAFRREFGCTPAKARA